MHTLNPTHTWNPTRLALLASLALAACHASAPVHVPMRETHRVEPPLMEPTGFRIETVCFDVPLELMESFGIESSPEGALLGVRVDETGRQTLLAASKDPAIRHVEHPPVIVEPGHSARIPAHTAAGVPVASDSLDLDVRASISYGFSPVELEVSLAWRDSRGAQIGRMSGSAPQPEGHWIETMCVPKAATGGVAILAFVRAVPLFADASPFANLDPGESVGSAKGHLANVGDVAIRYAVDGARTPVDVELGTSGRAQWVGDMQPLAVRGGGHAFFVCIGRANSLTFTFGDADGGGTIEIHGSENRCTNVANGFAGTAFESRPESGSSAHSNHLDLGGEPGNVVGGRWSDR